MLRRFSDEVAKAERKVAAALLAAVFLLIMMNVVTRATGNAVYWADEAAIYAMVWLTMVGASVTVHAKQGVAVTLLTDLARGRTATFVFAAIDLLILLCALALLAFSWIWFDLPGIAAAGFDLEAFQGKTFNFIYSEPTNTLGLRKFWVWLVMPATAATMSVHALRNFAERIRELRGALRT